MKFLAVDAQSVLNNDAYKAAWDKLYDKLEALTRSCDPSDKDAAQRVVIAKQIHYGLRRELEKLMRQPDNKVNLKEVRKERLFKR